MKLSNVFLLLLGVIFISGCIDQPQDQTATPTVPVTPTGEVKEYTIRESNFELDPATITANLGDTVRITVINDQGTHNLFIEGYNQRVNIVPAGTTQVMEFVADRAGTFDMWCEVAGHRDAGMEGQLIVS
ncbi:hypothetical protein ANME2D_01182 [Candidatus Methanoperedens nitroreducens]|uniref:EfeO-type cupredoxin-like domain-containing protein n=1 Tax=Candidatus Methanoperedens nitratireducens TaxID=1392998 RepID=A0A062V835_9EURY|nr:cupredoxin domain-containing protein [Candidatus Methanoperedens nitroreducens]KCZ72748.1 hypothetical protein ANME2D_01182 [Candidatus Methanoperedens nitroreducens]MDJ1423319.1 cupredoxin domain-containing protein [Candidatus Methanoperedens sp.]